MTYRILVDLNKSDSFKNEQGHLITRDNGRIYSIKSNDNIKKSYLVDSHASRVIAYGVRFIVNEGGRLAVLRTGQKGQHAFIQCERISTDISEQCHADFLKQSASFISYDPRTMESFALSSTERLCKHSILQPIFTAKTVYLYENSVLFIN